MLAAAEKPVYPRAARALRFTRDMCRQIETLGLLPDRWELIEGEIVDKMGTNLPHALLAQRVQRWLYEAFSADRLLATCSIDVDPHDNPTNEPEPDLIVLNRPAVELGRNPIPGDIVLLIEVSDSSLNHDTGPKANLYARAGIAEYWVIDIQGRRIWQHREPRPSGYSSLRIAQGSDMVSPLAQPNAALTPERIF